MPHSNGVRPLTNGKAVLIALAIATVLTSAGSCDVSSPSDGSQPASGAPANPGNTGNAGNAGNAGSATASLNALTVAAAGSMSGYSREKFPHWIGQGSGCDTREVVLKRDGKDVKTGADCKVTAGSWVSPYDDKAVTDPGALDIDHMVPLAAAWRSGAAAWTDEQRKGFANDLTRPQLFAVSLQSNRAKGDQDPSTWKPPSHTYWCTYAQNWVTVKAFYKLTVTQAEKTALADMLATCK
ncbi:GmrSD restriction endonuclease domain-containing protein [Dactylosporangium salmoneum]|uniref:GmrSD restriction endonucleases C-terminal domain-containing protein n=1 Tax=Dactylosporangium salmoneum TaxID=53361 RepID=A0ABN3GGM4_9ACTN